MLGKVIDMNSVEAYVNLEDGRTINVCILNLPEHIKIGDSVSVTPSAENIASGTFSDFPRNNIII